MAALTPIDVPSFGHWLENRRLSKKFANGQPWSQAEVAKRLRKVMAPFGVKVAEGQVDQFEGGKHPSWHWLFGLSVVFGVSLNETVNVLIDAMAEKDESVRDLICQAKGVQTASAGGPQDETKRRLSEAEADLGVARSRLKEAQKLAKRIVDISTDRRPRNRIAQPEPSVS